jgi:hypothetical protein
MASSSFDTWTFFSSMLGASVPIAISALLNSKFTLDRERRVALWRKKLDRLSDVEDLSGTLVEYVCSYKQTEPAKVYQMLDQIEELAGRMLREESIRQLIRDLVNAINRLLDVQKHHEDDRPMRAEVHEILSKLRTACIEATDKL